MKSRKPQRITGTIARQPDETAADAATRIGPDGVLITAGAWAGLDTAVRRRSIVVPRTPYAKLEMTDGDITTTYLDALRA